MTDDSAGAGGESLSLAVEFFRAPAKFPELLRGPTNLPPGVTRLLLVAAGISVADKKLATSGIAADELRQAALFFIEQVLLAQNANHYRILGLAPGARIDEIKEHHRLLMRLFHPDRQSTPDTRRDAIATRINQAYNALRSPDARATYDRKLKERLTANAPIKSGVRHHPAAPQPDLPMHPPSFATRYRTQFALSCVALVGALGVMLVYLTRVPTGAIGAGETHFSRAPDNESRHPTEAEFPPVLARALAEANRAEHHPSVAVADKEADETVIQQAGNNRKPEPTVTPATTKSAVAKLIPSQPPTTSSIAERLPPSSTLTGATASAGAAVAVNLPEMPENKPERPRPEQLNRLVANLSEQYQRGDLDSLLALFDPSARMERGDKKQIRAEYGDLFRNSENRTLHIWDMAWTGDGKVMRGEGNFQARVLRKGDQSPRIYGGAVTIEVIQHNDKPLIVGFFHKTESN